MIINKIIVALDQMGLDEIDQFFKKSGNNFPIVKIGLELFLKYGPDLIHKIHLDYKKKIFLDLKLHDIPITVERAIHSLKNLPIDFLTIHLSGGESMIRTALIAGRESIPNCKILGVSFLTSLEESDLKNLFGITNLEDGFIRLFNMANICGIDGVICSPLELILLKKNFPKLLAITPGVRFADEIKSAATQDQRRVSTPQEAILMGADYLVIGRSLTKATNLNERLIELKD